MFTCKKQNYHHSKLPKIGEIGFINLPQYHNDRFMVSHYPLCDNVLPYSKGIHTAYFKRLKDNAITQFSGFYFYND